MITVCVESTVAGRSKAPALPLWPGLGVSYAASHLPSPQPHAAERPSAMHLGDWLGSLARVEARHSEAEVVRHTATVNEAAGE